MNDFQKQPPYRNKKITDSARGEQCTMQLGGICNHDPSTTVFAHSMEPEDRIHGSQKADDWCGAYVCSSCHDVYDMRDGRWKEFGSLAITEEFRAASKKTLRRLFQKGIIK